MKKELFGRMGDGTEVSLITLANKKGMKAVVSDLGAVLVSLIVPDRDGNPVDVVTGYGSAAGYEEAHGCFGATIGRNGNRIGGGLFSINGTEYQLQKNQAGKHSLHSGPAGYQKRKWNYEEEEGDDAQAVTFFINSPDGDQGFPGSLDVEVTYTLTDDNELMISYYGMSDKDTVFNMTNHSYFNLNGHASGDVLGHTVIIYSDAITATDADQIPTGELIDVTGTPFDFREPHTIGERIGDRSDINIVIGNGYDHNFVVNGGQRQEDAQLVASCRGDRTGIVMEVYTDLPDMQMYTANTTDIADGKDGVHYRPHCGVCFETQYAPNAVNIPAFRSPVIKAFEERQSLTVYRFLTEA
ncbi:MAG: galactose mutarotase [Lachnospiraceae bacterium]|nr:galactose mutarotase [Lachnospiraceae bacterium]MBP5254282.1 galactose mutarotase [Lachnospiraceae bacterium]